MAAGGGGRVPCDDADDLGLGLIHSGRGHDAEGPPGPEPALDYSMQRKYSDSFAKQSGNLAAVDRNSLVSDEEDGDVEERVAEADDSCNSQDRKARRGLG